MRRSLVLAAVLMMLTTSMPAAEPSGNTAFAVDLYKQLARRSGNLVVSPYSISVALAMVHAGANGETAKELERAAHFPSDVRSSYSLLARQLDAGPAAGFELTSANAMWVARGVPLRDPFVRTIEKDFGAKLEHLDFAGASETARATINQWVSDETKGKIANLIPSGALDKLTRLVLTNAVYLKAKWLSQFTTAATRPKPFHLDAKSSIDVPTMWQRHNLRVAHRDGVRVVELPYTSGAGLAMYIVLPDAIDGLGALESSLTAATLTEWIGAVSNADVSLSLPRFKNGAQFSLEEQLRALGVRRAFSREDADFSGMTADERLYVGRVIHEARIDVTEEGTEAAAATAVMMQRASAAIRATQPEVIDVDHPFLYVIRKGDAIVFMGRVRDPR